VPNSLLGTDVLATLRELESGDAPGFFKDYFQTILSSLPKHLSGIDTAIRVQNPKQLSQSAHALKSCCANIRITSITELTTQLEALGNSGSTQGAQLLFAQLAEICATLKSEIEALPELIA
jgi:HPt (histidine-containing phosphotransfer) domain-containing protein